jgi:hypothetical protein
MMAFILVKKGNVVVGKEEWAIDSDRINELIEKRKESTPAAEFTSVDEPTFKSAALVPEGSDDFAAWALVKDDPAKAVRFLAKRLGLE